VAVRNTLARCCCPIALRKGRFGPNGSPLPLLAPRVVRRAAQRNARERCSPHPAIDMQPLGACRVLQPSLPPHGMVGRRPPLARNTQPVPQHRVPGADRFRRPRCPTPLHARTLAPPPLNPFDHRVRGFASSFSAPTTLPLDDFGRQSPAPSDSGSSANEPRKSASLRDVDVPRKFVAEISNTPCKEPSDRLSPARRVAPSPSHDGSSFLCFGTAAAALPLDLLGPCSASEKSPGAPRQVRPALFLSAVGARNAFPNKLSPRRWGVAARIRPLFARQPPSVPSKQRPVPPAPHTCPPRPPRSV